MSTTTETTAEGQGKPAPPKAKKVDIKASIQLVFDKIHQYNESLPAGRTHVKQQHANTLARAITLYADLANRSKLSSVIEGTPWPTLKTNGRGLGKQMLQRSRSTIDSHFERLKEAGLAVVRSGLIGDMKIRRAYSTLLVSINPDVIKYFD